MVLWLPALHPDLVRQLPQSGLDPGDAADRPPPARRRTVADVGCGNGLALIELATGYPSAKLVGCDIHPPAIEAARRNAEEAGPGDRIRFEVLDVTQGLPGDYDLITRFDVIHDLPHPRQALRAIRKALAPGGSFFVLEFNFSDDLQENIDHPFGIGAFGYAASVNYCMTTALAAGGEGTGTCMGERRLREFAAAAGFGRVTLLDLPQNPFNLIFELKARQWARACAPRPPVFEI